MAVLIIAAVAALVGIYAVGAVGGGGGTPYLDYEEIREYEGADLSSINDFRENSIKGPQYIDLENYHLNVSGVVENQLELTYAEVLDGYQNYKKVVTLYCVEGWDVTILWEGVLVSDLIEQAQALPGAEVVIFHAYDSYTTSLPLQYIQDENILMAYRINGVDLPPERGAPFQLVAEDRLGYKWIKWITGIELSDDSDYKGYWERRGYPNDAFVD